MFNPKTPHTHFHTFHTYQPTYLRGPQHSQKQVGPQPLRQATPVESMHMPHSHSSQYRR